MIKTDLIVIGAGPTGLFTVFEAGLLGMKCHLVDSLTRPGGQCVEIYPNKPIYDIPAHPEILAGKLVDNLMDQIKPFSPDFSLGEIAQKLEKKEDHFILKTNKGTKIQGKVIVIAGGLGNFEPRKPSIDDLDKFENNGIQYSIIEKEKSDCLSFRIISPVASFCGVENVSITRYEYLKVLNPSLNQINENYKLRKFKLQISIQISFG